VAVPGIGGNFDDHARVHLRSEGGSKGRPVGDEVIQKRQAEGCAPALDTRSEATQ
jgi:hypothetical protein